MDNKKILLFDGVCNLCASAVQFVLKRNKKENIYFASLQSNIGQQLMQQHQLDSTVINSLVYIENGKAYSKSTGALRMAKQLSGLWPLLYGFIIVPPFIRNVVYNWVAKNRYRWFGKQETCWLPQPKWNARFLDKQE